MGNNEEPLAGWLSLVLLTYMTAVGTGWSADTNDVPATTNSSTTTPGQATNAPATNSNGSNRETATPLPVRTAARGNNPLAEFQIKPGFKIEIVAPGFDVFSPVALAFDERGRLFVAEMRDYPDRRETEPHLGRIRVLQASKGDGVLDTSTVYADDLPWPSAVACYDGGVFVAATPNVLYLKDTGRDGSADVRKVVFTGVGGASNALSPDKLLNGLSWGLDNRFHIATAGIGGVVNPAEGGSEPLELGNHDFSFDPRTLTAMLETGPGQSGLTFDDRGRKYLSDFLRPLRLAVIPERYVVRNPFLPAPPELLDAISPTNRVYQFLPSGGATAAVSNGVARELVGRGLTYSWFAQARGCVIYRGNAFPSNYFGNAFIADSAAHVIHRAVLRQNGVEMTAERPADERMTEFLMSRDPLFHPTQIINGPDGALYVADLRAGGDSGRIYRIVPDNFLPQRISGLDRTNTAQLVLSLAHANGWHRDTAARMLYEKQDAVAVPLLSNVVNNARMPLARLHALHALAGLGALNEAHILRGMRDPDERVRGAAVQLCQKLNRAGMTTDGTWEQLKLLASDPSAWVRFELAFALGEFQRPDKPLVVFALLGRDLDSPWMRAAILSSLNDGASQVFAGLAASAPIRSSPAGWGFLEQLSAMLGVQNRPEELSPALDMFGRQVMSIPQTYRLLRTLADGLERNRGSLVQVDTHQRLQPFYAQAMLDALDNTILTSNRVEAIRFLGVSRYTYTEVGDWLLLTLGSGESESVQAAALATLGQFNDPRIAANIIMRWRILPPGLHDSAMGALLAEEGRISTVLAAFESGIIPLGDLSSLHANFLRTHSDPGISQRAVRLFGPVSLARPDVVNRFKPGLRTKGVVSRGRVVFLARCATCHRLNGEGRQEGPDLDWERNKERIFAKILEPNLGLTPAQAPWVAETFSARYLVGLLTDQNPATLTLRLPDGVPVVVPRPGLRSLQVQSWSLMPEGLEQGLSVQDLADLLEYMVARR